MTKGISGTLSVDESGEISGAAKGSLSGITGKVDTSGNTDVKTSTFWS